MNQPDYTVGSDGAARPARGPQFLRIAYTIGFALVAWVTLWFLFALTVLQIAVGLIVGEPNKQLAEFGARLGSFLRDIARYIMGASDTPPFPFAPFPEA
jgi:hypothetical protein